MTDQIDAIDLLVREHRAIDALAAQLDDTDDPAEIDRLFRRIVEMLAAHEAMEHEVIFPAFRAAIHDGSDHTIDRREGEHEELNDVIAEMQSLAPDSFGFEKRASALLLDVRGHMEREEESVFARMRELMTADALADLGARAGAVQQRTTA
jgi:hemerythrin superfamily protein